MGKQTLEDSLVDFRNNCDHQVESLRKIGRINRGGREISLVITKLQEARLWAGEALKEMGYFEQLESAKYT